MEKHRAREVWRKTIRNSHVCMPIPTSCCQNHNLSPSWKVPQKLYLVGASWIHI